MEICFNIFFKPKTSKVLSAASPKLRHVWALSFTKRVHPSLQASMGCSVSRAVDDNSPSSRIFRLLSSSRWLRNFRDVAAGGVAEGVSSGGVGGVGVALGAGLGAGTCAGETGVDPEGLDPEGLPSLASFNS